MVILMAAPQPDEYTQHESYYQTDYGRWNGYVHRIPVLRQIIDIRAASIFSSWLTKGTHARQAKSTLDEFEGRGNETFRLIMENMYKIAYICGDAYAIKIYEDENEEYITDLHILPSDNIRQVIQKGKILRYEEIDGDKKWEHYQIFHLRYKPRGAMTHGIGMVESLNNILLSYEQMIQIGQEIYERMSRPREWIFANTDNPTKLQTIRTALKEAGETWSGVVVIPKTLIDKQETTQLTVSLKPQEWLDTLSKEIFKATATPELVLGTGYSTSEEDAKTRISGYIQSIRRDQNWMEENVKKQIFMEMWPTSPPDIEFSFANEAQDESFRRNMEAIPVIEASQVISPENKNALIQERLEEAGLIK